MLNVFDTIFRNLGVLSSSSAVLGWLQVFVDSPMKGMHI